MARHSVSNITTIQTLARDVYGTEDDEGMRAVCWGYQEWTGNLRWTDNETIELPDSLTDIPIGTGSVGFEISAILPIIDA